MDDTFPDLGNLADEELKAMIDRLTAEETEVSYRRRILHGQIDILRAELVSRLRLRHEEGGTVIHGSDVDRLTEILGGRAAGLRPVPDGGFSEAGQDTSGRAGPSPDQDAAS